MAASTARSERARKFKALRKLWSKIKRIKPAKDPEYLQWLHSQHCAIPECSSSLRYRAEDAIEAAHVGMRGLRQKCSDREALPLCAWHHRIGSTSHHRMGRNFWLYWQLDRDDLVTFYNERYEQEKAA